MINELIKLANYLDNKGYHKEADYIDARLRKEAMPAWVVKAGAGLLSGGRWILGGPWSWGAVALLHPSSTAAHNSCEDCTGWPMKAVEDLLDMGTQANPRFESWNEVPEALRDLVAEYSDDCCGWSYSKPGGDWPSKISIQGSSEPKGDSWDSEEEELAWNHFNNKNTTYHKMVFGYLLNDLTESPGEHPEIYKLKKNV